MDSYALQYTFHVSLVRIYLEMFDRCQWFMILILSLLIHSICRSRIVSQFLIYNNIFPTPTYDPLLHGAVHRHVLDDVIDRETCAELIKIIRKGTYSDPSFQNSDALTEAFTKKDQYHAMSENVDDGVLISRVRGQVYRAIAETLNLTHPFIDFGDMTKRVPYSGNKIFAGHQFHVDNCALRGKAPYYETIAPDLPSFVWKLANMTPWNEVRCLKTLKSCCLWRTHTAVLYLNGEDDEFEDIETLRGGHFFFIDRDDVSRSRRAPFQKGFECEGCALYDMVRVPTKCGRVVMISSDTKNAHGTLPVWEGERFALPFWFTDLEFFDRDEKHFNINMRTTFNTLLKICERYPAMRVGEYETCLDQLEASANLHWPALWTEYASKTQTARRIRDLRERGATVLGEGMPF